MYIQDENKIKKYRYVKKLYTEIGEEWVNYGNDF